MLGVAGILGAEVLHPEQWWYSAGMPENLPHFDGQKTNLGERRSSLRSPCGDPVGAGLGFKRSRGIRRPHSHDSHLFLTPALIAPPRPTTHPPPAGGILAWEVLLMHFVEVRRWQDYRKFGSVNSDPIFTNNSVPNPEMGYPGGIFDPLGFRWVGVRAHLHRRCPRRRLGQRACETAAGSVRCRTRAHTAAHPH